jgi:hypothetical protein
VRRRRLATDPRPRECNFLQEAGASPRFLHYLMQNAHPRVLASSPPRPFGAANSPKIPEEEGRPLAVDSTRSAWISKAEDKLRTIPGVDGASLHVEEDELAEVHITTRSTRKPKFIVRDVQTVLATYFNRRIDHRIVSVAMLTDKEPEAQAAPAPEIKVVAPASSRPAERSEPERGAARESERERDAEPQGETAAERIRFYSVNLFSSGLKTTAQVELRWKGVIKLGSATGWTMRGGAHRLVASATVEAVQGFVMDDVGLAVHGVETVGLGRQRVMVVSISLLAHRQEKLLVGTCAVEQDSNQAVVLATLSALNRIVGQLRTREPIEYVLRPTST